MMAGAFDDVVAAVSAGLASLPGVEAQLRMAPQPRGGWKPGFAPDAARIFTGKQDTVKPSGGSCSRLCSFSR